MAVKYHTTERDQEIETRIKMLMQDLATAVGTLLALSNNSPFAKNAFNRVAPLRQAISRQHFEDEHISSLKPNSELLQQIVADGLALKQALIGLKNAQFQG